MPVVVVEQHVDQPRRQYGARVDTIERIGVDALEQVLAVEDLDCAGKSAPLLWIVWALFHRPKLAGKNLSELTVQRVIGHHEQPREGVEHTRRCEDRRSRQG